MQTEVSREVEVEATPEEVWEALVTEEGRERWLDEPDRRDPHRVGRPAQSAGVVVGRGGGGRDPRRVPDRRAAPWHPRRRDRELSVLPAGDAGVELHAGGGLSDELGPVFAALADPTRRHMLSTLHARGQDQRAGPQREPADLPPGGRQAPGGAGSGGLLERLPARRREVRYGLREGALTPAARLAPAGRGRHGRGAWDGSRGRSRASAQFTLRAATLVG